MHLSPVIDMSDLDEMVLGFVIPMILLYHLLCLIHIFGEIMDVHYYALDDDEHYAIVIERDYLKCN
jgi:hypothetical protein